MKMQFGFSDLCINLPENKSELQEILFKLHKVGYRNVVINQNVDESVFENEKKKKKKAGTVNTCPYCIPKPFNIQDLEMEFTGKLNIFNRITFTFSDPLKTHSINQLAMMKNYDLYAVIPKTQNAFQFACAQLNVDVIFINSTCKGLKLSRKLYLQAVERGIHFEIQYSDVINLSTRKLAIHYSHLFYTFGKSKNVVLSSGANSDSLIRNPYDIINLARLLGLNETNAKNALGSNTISALLKGEGRRSGKSFFKIHRTEKVDDDVDLSNIPSKKIKLCD
ncbi:ribonuclease P protein subunit p30 [Phymastichus coffea]|uniref:ribonuclease P protein subunit p30 n=1 Tax=Phymastichus coffea TaxID=108790 RepID=UPI00273BA2AC|nr:ribonuclease P protein subunit p30 [Phymastichus coffea]